MSDPILALEWLYIRAKAGRDWDAVADAARRHRETVLAALRTPDTAGHGKRCSVRSMSGPCDCGFVPATPGPGADREALTDLFAKAICSAMCSAPHMSGACPRAVRAATEYADQLDRYLALAPTTAPPITDAMVTAAFTAYFKDIGEVDAQERMCAALTAALTEGGQ